MTAITAAGVYDITAEQYHADPVPGGSLSSTGARRLLPPSCPALFRHEQLHPQPHRPVFEFGHAAHKMVLGDGPDLAVVDAADWRGRDAQQQRAEIRERGAVPLLRHEHEQVLAMAEAIRAHPIAGRLFAPERGTPEQTLVWQDPVTGVWCRARPDWTPHAGSGRLIVADYKTTQDASPSALPKTVYQRGYHQQAAWYLDGVHELGLATDAAFVFVFQEKSAPYLVTVTELSADALRWGDVLNAKARDTYRRCVESGRWPGYSESVELTPLPVWAERAYEDAREAGDYDLKGHQPA
ncbi:PD-(D/E)XK nuclease-like domain-containing protein [Actinopolyspora halophila]|uniref:PD-(D/E)XK nuclease-like domain-containing protein n=1 Tax=Actinopolyspora halophila TaxID=1850 RepID=UPI00036B52BB|nr:PD-(D/E)XK nuclease-like domain-containing protein [Actinopolyspora halophila]